MNTHPVSNTATTNPYNIPQNYRGVATESIPQPVAIDPITEITQIIRTLVYYYTENISQHNRVIDTYNQNITTLLTLLNNIIEIYASRNRSVDNNDYYRNIFQSNRGRGNNRNRSIPLDFSNLVYLLNIPIQTTVGGGATSTAERPIPLTLTEIAHATRIIYYNESMGERRCPISLDDFIPNEQICQIRGCRHIFKPQHLLRWLESHVECPVCRYDLRQYHSSTPPPAPASTPNTTETEMIDIPTIDISMNLNSEALPIPQNIPNSSESSRPIRRNASLSEFLPILENILSSPSSTNFSSYLASDNINQNTSIHSETNASSNLSNLLSNRFSQILSDIILEQVPAVDSSNNLLYTIEIPLTR